MFLRYNVNAKGNAQSIRFVNKKRMVQLFFFLIKIMEMSIIKYRLELEIFSNLYGILYCAYFTISFYYELFNKNINQ